MTAFSTSGMAVPSSLCVIIAILVLTTEEASSSNWKYQDEAHWSPKCQEGKKQSPIALRRSAAKIIEYKPFLLSGYDQKVSAVLKNNGHSAEVKPNITQDRPEIAEGGLSQVYQLDHLHFHWQSEHVMDNYRFPLELHMVHYAKHYQSLSNALEYPGGVAVFAVLFDLSPDDDDDFKPLLDIVDTIKDRLNQPVTLSDFVIKNFLPRDLAGYYRYEGSLTTPGCDEGIVWTVFTNTIPISKEQIKIFEAMHTEGDIILKQNYRSLQPLNDRELYLKVSPIRGNTMGGGAGSKLTSLLLIFTCLLYLFNH